MINSDASNRENFDKLAPLYDTYLDLSFEVETNWYGEIEVRFRELGTVNNKVIDIGCGTGTFGIYLGNLGYNVMGLDSSSNMLIVARNKLKLFNSSREDMRQTLMQHPYMVADPNAKVHLSKIKPMIRFIQGDILEAQSVKESFGGATMFDALSYIHPSRLDTLFANVSSIVLPNGFFCVLFFTDLFFKANIGSANVEKEMVDYSVETSWADESHRTIRRRLSFKAAKSVPASADIEFVEYSHSIRDIASLYEKHGFQIQKMVCDTHICAEDEGNISQICDAVERSYELANGVRKVLMIGRKTG